MATITELLGRMRERQERAKPPSKDIRESWYQSLISDFSGRSRLRSESKEETENCRSGSITSLHSEESRGSKKSGKSNATAPVRRKKRRQASALSQAESLPSLGHQYTSVAFSASSSDVSSSGSGGGLKYMLSGEPTKFSFRTDDRAPSLEQINRLFKDHRRGPKQPLQVDTERVSGVKIPAAPAFNQLRRREMHSIIERLSRPTVSSKGSFDKNKCIQRRLESEEVAPSVGKDRDALQKERDFDHLQKHTLMSKIRGEMTRIFAPDPYGLKTHKWPW